MANKTTTIEFKLAAKDEASAAFKSAGSELQRLAKFGGAGVQPLDLKPLRESRGDFETAVRKELADRVRAQRAAERDAQVKAAADSFALRPKPFGDEAEIRKGVADAVRVMRDEAKRQRIERAILPTDPAKEVRDAFLATKKAADEATRGGGGGEGGGGKKPGGFTNALKEIKESLGEDRVIKGILGGGLVGLAGEKFAGLTEKVLELKEAFAKGELSATGMAQEVLKSIPIIGGFAAAGAGLREIFTGEKAALEEANREAERMNRLQETRLDLSKQIAAYEEQIATKLASLDFDRQLHGLEGLNKALGQIVLTTDRDLKQNQADLAKQLAENKAAADEQLKKAQEGAKLPGGGVDTKGLALATKQITDERQKADQRAIDAASEAEAGIRAKQERDQQDALDADQKLAEEKATAVADAAKQAAQDKALQLADALKNISDTFADFGKSDIDKQIDKLRDLGATEAQLANARRGLEAIDAANKQQQADDKATGPKLPTVTTATAVGSRFVTGDVSRPVADPIQQKIAANSDKQARAAEAQTPLLQSIAQVLRDTYREIQRNNGGGSTNGLQAF